jgi:hypothetical protein
MGGKQLLYGALINTRRDGVTDAAAEETSNPFSRAE